MSIQVNIFGQNEETTSPIRQKKTPSRSTLPKNRQSKHKNDFYDQEPEQIIIKPNSLVIYTPRKNYSGRKGYSDTASIDDNNNDSIIVPQNDDPLLNPVKSHRKNITNGFLSDRAGNRLRTFIKFLLWSSGCFKIHGKQCTMKMTGKISFITLTLPSTQKHSDQYIKEKCLNQFITELKAKHLTIRYIWRAEKQNNGNIHFHFLVNRFVHYDWCQHVWNRILDKEGYILPYTTKFSSFTFLQYCEQKKNFSLDKIPLYQRQFKRGCKEGWKNPPSIQAKGLGNTRKALYYISKYVSKNNIQPENLSADQVKLLAISGHIWFCCYELSSLISPSEFMTNEVCHDLAIIKKLNPDAFFYDNFITVIRLSIEQLFNLGCYHIYNIFVTTFGVLQRNELFNST